MLWSSLRCLYDIYRMVNYLPEGLDAQSDCLIAQVIRLASRPVRLSDGLKGPVACPGRLEVNLSWVVEIGRPPSDDPYGEVMVAPGRDLAEATRLG